MKRISNLALFLFAIYINISAQPAGYYNGTESLAGSALKAALHNLIRNHTKITYDQVWDALKIVDEDPENPNNVILIYTGRSQEKEYQDRGALFDYSIYDNGNGTYSEAWNREHIWPKSHGFPDESDTAYTDIHHLRPADRTVNSSRNERDFDNGGTPQGEAPDTYISTSTWEPRDEVKGDIARIIFYMTVRYECGDIYNLELVDSTGTLSGESLLGRLSTLREWNINDPVDINEQNRNDAVFGIQGNRNPFVDHPEFVEKLFEDSSEPVINIFFTEYVEGSGSNKALEIGNKSETTVNFDTDDYKIEFYFNGSVTPGRTIILTGTVNPHNVFVVANSSASADILAVADLIYGGSDFNGNDAIILKRGSKIFDVIGKVGEDPGIEWGSGLGSTADNTLRRKHSVITGDIIENDTFDPSAEWEGYAIDYIADLGTAVLPVELISFAASVFDGSVLLDWQTATEVNNYGFSIERSVILSPDLVGTKNLLSRNWQNMGFVEGNGNSNSTKEYSFVDKDITSGSYSYRLKQIDIDGSFTHSKEITVKTLHATSLPQSFELFQNYPNPFNPSTTIKFGLPKDSHVTLEVFNIIGEKAAELVNKEMEAGYHQVNFTANKLTSGMYIYRIKAGEFIQTRKLLLMK